MGYCYFLRSTKIQNWIYIGSTNNIAVRWKEHQNGLVQSTKAFHPLRLAGYIAVETEHHARGLEKYFKTGSGKAILKKRILTNEALA